MSSDVVGVRDLYPWTSMPKQTWPGPRVGNVEVNGHTLFAW